MSAKASIVRNDKIQYSFQLVFDEKGGLRMTRLRGNINRGERAMTCTLTVPRSIFRTPELTASISIAENEISPVNIDVEGAAQALRAVLGIDVDLQVKDGRDE